MWKCLALCILVVLWRDAHGQIAQMTEIVKRCCADVSGYSANHTEVECSSPQAVPADVPSTYAALCVVVRAQCCKEYYHKKEDCSAGIKLASSGDPCRSSSNSTLMCCKQCNIGALAGRSGGSSACARPRGSSEDSLADEAYVNCCLKAVKEAPEQTHPVSTGRKEKRENVATVASLCEEYAPNELCAHHCIPLPGWYKCECNPGFMLMADGRNCKEVMKNRCKPRNHCQHKCNDNGFEVKCSCRRGYELMPDGKSCQDIDECQLDMRLCLAGTVCSNVAGSYRCLAEGGPPAQPARGHCPPGFTRNALNQACDDINECKLRSPPCPAHVCENTVGGYRCDGKAGDPAALDAADKEEERCPPGFALGEKGDCEDVDECANQKDDCNSRSQFCINTHSSFFCQDKASKLCRPGFKVNPSTGKCEDIDECEEDDEVCRPDQVCVNQLGQYDCKTKTDQTRVKGECPDGLRLDPATRQCEDINECLDGTHLCDQHQSCVNTVGSFECHCKPGYELDITMGACVDVNECATGQNSCIDGLQRCDNTVGSFLCIRIASCGTGYILQHATGNCEDVDECALGTANCYRAGPDYQCLNLPGSFRCIKKRAPTTSTTTTSTTYPDDDYYYVYEDSVEEDGTNQTNVNPQPPPAPVDIPYSAPSSIPPPLSAPATTPPTSPPPPAATTATPTSSTTEPHTTPEKEPNIADNSVYPESDRGDSKPESSKPQTPTLQYKPPEKLPETSEQVPQTPEQGTDNGFSYSEPPRYAPGPIETQSEPSQYQPEIRPTDPPFTYSEPKEPEVPVQPEIVYTDRSEKPISTYYDTRSEIPDRPISNEVIPTERQLYLPKSTEAVPTIVLETEPSIIKLEPKEVPTYSPYRPTSKPQPTPPYAVVVNVGQESATVSRTQEEDGSVVIDTNEVPKNTWTSVKVNPIACPVGFESNDNGGCFDVDECATNQHSCSGLTEICRNNIGGYLCDCADGFRRDSNTGACDIMPSSTIQPPVFWPLPSIFRFSSTSTTTSTTTEAPPPPTIPVTMPSTTPKLSNYWGYREDRLPTTRPFLPRFTCDAGFQMNPQTRKCEDIDECTNGQANCAALEVCVNTRGGYVCECPPRWELDRARHRCVPRHRGGFPPGYENVPETRQPSPDFVEPVQRVDEPEPKRCSWGYQLGDDDNCEDIDECARVPPPCGMGTVCSNLPGGYVCSCPAGHRRTRDDGCEDVDECALARNTSICSQHADCVNTVGSYQCRCHSGFRSAPVNDKVCVDVDECAESRAGVLCQQRCSNVWGGYRCHCHRGYRLHHDNRTCVDVDECSQKSRMPCVGRCVNVPGSYRCSCPRGYRLSEDKRSCIDIDECESGEASCATGMTGGTSDVCVNTRGSYRCQRISCPPGYRLENKHRCSKIERVCQAGDRECSHQPSTISYNFITFVSKLYVPESNVKLFTMRGPTWPYAKMKFELRLLDVNAPPSVKDKADIGAFLLIQTDNEGVMSLVRPLEGPQSIELELSMELYSGEQFGGIAVAKLFIIVSEYEF